MKKKLIALIIAVIVVIAAVVGLAIGIKQSTLNIKSTPRGRILGLSFRKAGYVASALSLAISG